jgi:uncharacterized membrane protein YfhO
MQVESDRDYWLVLADTYYPGWTALVNGQPAEIQHANLMFRAVQVPAGPAVVEFDYRPAWLVPALLLSIAGLVMMLVLFRLGNNPDLAKD